MKHQTGPKPPAAAPAVPAAGAASAAPKGGKAPLLAAVKTMDYQHGTAALSPRGGGGPAAGGGAHAPAASRPLAQWAKDLPRNFKDRLRGVAGIETGWSRIRDLVAKAVSVADPERKDALLTELNDLCRQWLARHGDDAERGPLIQALAGDVDREMDAVAHQRVAATQAAGQGIYMDNVRHAQGAPETHGLQALSMPGLSAAVNVPAHPGAQAAMAEGLSEAEVAAIQIFTASDYSYINPATANAPGWMADQKAKPEFGLGGVDDRTLMQEGSLHAAVALQGLKKMKPYERPTYRGARFSRAEFASKFKPGQVTSFNSLASSAQDEMVAAGFASGATTEAAPAADKEIAVISVLHDAGGRDINALSVVPGEAEVLILPGTQMVVQNLERVTDLSKYQPLIDRASAGGRPAAKEWWLATLVPAPKGKSGGAPGASGAGAEGSAKQPAPKALPPLPTKPGAQASKPAGGGLAPAPALPSGAHLPMPTKPLPQAPVPGAGAAKKPGGAPAGAIPALGAAPKKPLPKPPIPSVPPRVKDDGF